jgi:DNA-binding response OmpR family regulator
MMARQTLKSLMLMKRTILLVDDDPSVREAVGEVLLQEGYTVVALANGRVVLEVVESCHAQLALLDLNLPNESGWEVFQKLTNHFPTLPIIIVTARSNQKFKALAAGVGALLEKPYNFPLLLDVIKRLLEEKPETRIARAKGANADLVPTVPTK